MMNVKADRIIRCLSSHHRVHHLYECLPCRYQCNSQATFLNHKATKKCALYNGDLFLKMKKKGFKDL